jgi:arylsulfatase A-like enzyme
MDSYKPARREVLAAALPAGLLAQRRPNVILILTDDQGYGDIAVHGNPVVRTPNMDRLHGESIRLKNFHVDPTCSPTRSALMTGRYSHRTGVWHTIMGRNFLRSTEVTMADVFRRSGYRTGIFGKWHLGCNYPFRPTDRGFEEWVGHGDGGTGTVSDYWANDKMNDTYYRNGKWEKFSGFGTDVFFDEAMKFIERNDGRPFFVYLPTNDAHSPCNVRREWLASYEAKGVSSGLRHFYASIERVDYQIGRLRGFLAKRGLSENTILVFLTDNGSARRTSFDPGMRGVKGSHYDGGHRVPFFMHWPGGGMGRPRDIGVLAAHLDVLPTLTQLCGLEAPGAAFDGLSLAPLLRGTGQPWPDRDLLVESQRLQYPEKWRQSAMMTARWRLINGAELYDVQADPAQSRDVASGNRSVVDRLRERYEAIWEGISKRDQEYCRTVIGTERQTETALTSIDWFAPEREVPWDQPHVLAGMRGHGFWPVEASREGRYRFELRRWPREADAAITAPLTVPAGGDIVCEPRGNPPSEDWRNGVAIPAEEAILRAGSFEQRKPVGAREREVVFEVPLRAGPVEVEARFAGGGETRGAYYVYVKRTG